MLDHLDDLDDRALDSLPYGVVCLDETLRVVRMNRAESDASGIQRWRALGRAFFRDVAPGPTNRQLADHVLAFAHRASVEAGPIAHTFPRRGREDRTTIELVHGRQSDRVYLCIHRA